jgi:hypothetical protein
VLSTFSVPKITSFDPLYYVMMLPTEVLYEPIVILKSLCTYLVISILMLNSSNKLTLKNIN